MTRITTPYLGESGTVEHAACESCGKVGCTHMDHIWKVRCVKCGRTWCWVYGTRCPKCNPLSRTRR